MRIKRVTLGEVPKQWMGAGKPHKCVGGCRGYRSHPVMEREKPRCRNGEKGKLVLTRGLLGGLEIEDALEEEGCNRHGKQLDHSQGSPKVQGLRAWVTWRPLCG